jgi:hypothetical protein
MLHYILQYPHNKTIFIFYQTIVRLVICGEFLPLGNPKRGVVNHTMDFLGEYLAQSCHILKESVFEIAVFIDYRFSSVSPKYIRVPKKKFYFPL